MTRSLMLRSVVVLALIVISTPFASAKHGGHGGGHGGGHHGHGGHVGGHGGGHHGGGHHGNSHHGSHHVSSHHSRHWYPQFGFHVSPSYRRSGISTYYSPNTYSGSYVTGYPRVESTPIVVEQFPPNAIIPTAARPITESDGQAFRQKAEDAFRAGDFQRAAKMANHALVEMPRDGKLLLFAAQTLFALGDYRNAAILTHQATELLEPQQWGFVVKNYRQFYRGRAYVDQMSQLTAYLKENPDADYAYFLRGYQRGFLGHQQAALDDLNKALELESRDLLAAQLITRFGGTPPAITDQSALESNSPADPTSNSSALNTLDDQSTPPAVSMDSLDEIGSSSHVHDHDQ